VIVKKISLLSVLLVSFCFADDFSVANEAFQNGDFQKAGEYYQKACESGHGAGCFNLALLYNDGQGVKQNYHSAKRYYGKACDLKYKMGCDNYKALDKQGY
jgi:TPR repeat protein